MTYGIIKVDTVTFTDAGVDKSVTLSGLVQNPTFSGNVTVTGTLSGVTVTGTTANFTSGNFTNISGGTHTITSGVFASGSAASPSITFTGDLNTGIYSPGADQVAISTGGSGRLFVDASGRVGIGTTSPSELLHVAGNARIGANDTSAAQLEVGAGATGNRNSYIDLIGDTTYTDYGFRLIRLGGANNNTVLRHRGTGEFAYITEDAAPLTFYTSNSERLRITSTGLVGVGASDPTELLDLRRANGAGNLGIRLVHVGQVEYKIGINDSDDKLYITNNNGDAAIGANATGIVITPTGSVGIGTTSPGSNLHVKGGTNGTHIRVDGSASGDYTYFEAINPSGTRIQLAANGTDSLQVRGVSNHPLAFFTNDTERARIDSSGRLLVGTSSTSANARVLLQGSSGNNNANLWLARSNSPGTGPSDKQLGAVLFCADNHVFSALIEAQRDGGTWTAGSSQPTLLAFSTTADGAGSPTERMRIDNAGRVGIGKTPASSIIGSGIEFGSSGLGIFTRSSDTPLLIHRTTNDGDLIAFYQDTNLEGSISVSGTTVSYNGAHLSRWSQLPGGIERTEILRGTILSNIDEMCEWPDEDNEQLNRMKVSDVEGDKNVSGVFQAWDDDDDTYTNDFYCAMTGDFIIRIGAGVTVERGDLLMSAGDGTAKPQDDDIIRSKTIAKVTSTNVTCTYDDGSYCVPCVLMAC